MCGNKCCLSVIYIEVPLTKSFYDYFREHVYRVPAEGSHNKPIKVISKVICLHPY